VIRAVVLDIEGTTSSLDHVRDVLFPYARARIPEWLDRAHPEVARLTDQVRELTGRPSAGLGEVTETLLGWVDDDVKVAPLKTLQGLIWEKGFAAGDLTAHVYDDVPPRLRAWTERGLRIHTYSSGSALAQRTWFRHTQHGDLRPCISGYFDIPSAGPKQEADSYRAIAGHLGLAEAEIVFLSDVRAELDAAHTAGLGTVAVFRSPDRPSAAGGHLAITTFDQLDLTGRRPALEPSTTSRG